MILKEKIRQKIDGFVVPIIVRERCIRNSTGKGSVYDERGVTVDFQSLESSCGQ